MLLVMQKRCDQCLYSDAKVVSDARKEDVLYQCAKKDAFFVCHKSPKGAQVCCRGFYDQNPMATHLMRLAYALDAVRAVPLEGLARLARPTTTRKRHRAKKVKLKE